MADLKIILSRKNLRLTAARQQVFNCLYNSSTPLPLAVLSQEAQPIDRVTVYRTINLFVSVGIVQLIHNGWKQSYELTELFKPHHHHFHCVQCQTVSEITDDLLEDAIVAIARRHNFEVTAHHFEISGLCQICAGANGRLFGSINYEPIAK